MVTVKCNNDTSLLLFFIFCCFCVCVCVWGGGVDFLFLFVCLFVFVWFLLVFLMENGQPINDLRNCFTCNMQHVLRFFQNKSS